MKKGILIIFIMFFVLFMGCSEKKSTKNINDEISTEVCDSEAVSMTDKILETQKGEWDTSDILFSCDCIPDEKTAISVTSVFLENFQKSNYFIDYVPQSVNYVPEENIWVVTFYKSTDFPGSDFTIAIRKDNAEVIKMWVGE